MQQSNLPSSLVACFVAIDKTLIKANSNGEDGFSTRESIEELCELCGTAGLSVSGSCIQRLSLPNPKTFLNAGDRTSRPGTSMSALASFLTNSSVSTGKLQELSQQCADLDVRTIVIDDDLTPRQQRYIEASLNSQRSLRRPVALSGATDESKRSEDPPERSSSLEEEEESAIDKYFLKINRAKNRQNGDLQPMMPIEEESAAQIKVLDRTAIILDIFAQHAKSREGQLQVELAMLEYRSTRGPQTGQEVGMSSAAAGRGSEGAGFRGPGESKVEMDKRDIKERIKMLKSEISSLELQRQTQRQSRHQLGMPLVALIGYTNAGKSTILNRLSKAGVLAEDMLFATLDPTTRKIRLPGRSSSAPSPDGDDDGDDAEDESRQGMELLLTDTVGFISKLPANIVAAFRATLESAADADVLIHVCDRSSPSWRKQRAVVMAEIESIANRRRRNHRTTVADVPIIELWNKIDLVEDVDQLRHDISAVPIEMEMELVEHAGDQIAATGAAATDSDAPTCPPSVEGTPAAAVDEELTNFVCMPDDQYAKPDSKKKKKMDPNNSMYQKNKATPSKKERLSKVANKATNGQWFVPADSDGLSVADGSEWMPAVMEGEVASPDSSSSSSSEVFRPRSQQVFVCAVSAKTGDGFDGFMDTLELAVSSGFERMECFVPFAEDMGVTSSILLKGVVEHVEYSVDGTRLSCRVPKVLAESLRRFEAADRDAGAS